jgi:TetR/AcrR family transcriptional regulator, transcriptional repressor of aconitase
MPRPVDPERHRARRLQIIDAGLTAFAEHGYAGATTAVICRTAGVGSGTFFHYFRTKLALLVAIIEEGTRETRAFFADHAGRPDPRAVIFDYLDHAVDDLADPRLAGFVVTVGGLLAMPEVEAALRADDETIRGELVPLLRAAQRAGQIRVDISAERLAVWVALVLDGFTERVALGDGFTPHLEAPLLIEQVAHLLGTPPTEGKRHA